MDRTRIPDKGCRFDHSSLQPLNPYKTEWSAPKLSARLTCDLTETCAGPFATFLARSIERRQSGIRVPSNPSRTRFGMLGMRQPFTWCCCRSARSRFSEEQIIAILKEAE